MTLDPIRESRKSSLKSRFGLSALIALVVILVLSTAMYLREVQYEFVDFRVHTYIAGDFDFTDLHSITSRLAYPMWHLLVAAVHQLGVPLEWAAAGVSAACKGATFVLVYLMVDTLSWGKAKRWVVTLLSLIALIVTCLFIRPVSYFVYKGVGSPNVWHNPTQQAVTLAMMMVMPWLAHCWYEFERMMEEGQKNVMLPWWKVIVLAVLCMGSLACKPTFMQALLPAAFVMFLVELIRRPQEWRYCAQIVIAFVPSAGYFLLQYLYYTGVVVEFTSGVEIYAKKRDVWVAIRNALMMSAAPLMALVSCLRKGIFKDRQIVLGLLMIFFSTLEAMFFHETGQREGHGNFTWAANSSSFYMWVIMLGVFLRCFITDVKSGRICILRKAGYALTLGLFVWHVYSGVYYLTYLMTTTNAF